MLTFKEYQEADKELDRQISQIVEIRKKLHNEFILDHAEFKKGDKVRVFKKGYGMESEERELGIAFIGYIKGIKYTGDIDYFFAKMKKDGTMGNVSAGFYWFDRIELIEKAK